MVKILNLSGIKLKKTPSHGTEFGLDPDYSPDGKTIRDRKIGKPRAKMNKMQLVS